MNQTIFVQAGHATANGFITAQPELDMGKSGKFRQVGAQVQVTGHGGYVAFEGIVKC
jgi:hypothetical protein